MHSRRRIVSAPPRRDASFRREIVSLHRQIFRRNRQRINQAVFGYTDAFRRYEREYARGVAHYQRRASFAELDDALAAANFVYLGDYHTLAQAQRTFLRLIRRLPEDRPVVIALELVPAQKQAALEAYLSGQLSEESFVGMLTQHAEWAESAFGNFRELFELAIRRGYPVIGLDAQKRGPAGSSLETRDRLAARLLAKAHRAHPDAVVMVLIGELHVAPCHLPRKVDELLDAPSRPLVIYQNCEEIYWQLEARGLAQRTEIVRIRTGEYCLLNTPPIVCQQSFLNWLEVEEAMPEHEAPEDNFKQYARLIASFFELPLGDALDDVELATAADLTFLSRLRRRGDFSAADMREIKKQILRSESYTIPRARMVYLGNLSINHASEEATHFVRHVCAPSQEPKQLVDAFYARCLEEAIGFLGSKLINHQRKCPHLAHFERVSRSRQAQPEERELARLVLAHARMEGGQKVRGLARIYKSDTDLFNAVTHVLGYRLGDKLYYGLMDGQITKAEIKSLFFDPFEDEGSALATYLYLVGRTRQAEIPERL